jgi:hypothetical protein
LLMSIVEDRRHVDVPSHSVKFDSSHGLMHPLSWGLMHPFMSTITKKAEFLYSPYYCFNLSISKYTARYRAYS